MSADAPRATADGASPSADDAEGGAESAPPAPEASEVHADGTGPDERVGPPDSGSGGDDPGEAERGDGGRPPGAAADAPAPFDAPADPPAGRGGSTAEPVPRRTPWPPVAVGPNGDHDDTDPIPPAPALDTAPPASPEAEPRVGTDGSDAPPAHLRPDQGEPDVAPAAGLEATAPAHLHHDLAEPAPDRPRSLPAGDIWGPPATAPEPARPARRRRRRVGRHGLRVRQRLWAVDPWSVFKVSVLFYFCLFLIFLVAGTLLWNVARSAGTIDQFEGFVSRLGAYGECVPEDEIDQGVEAEVDDDCADGELLVGGFALDDGTIFRAALFGGLILVAAGSLGNVLLTVLLNLINEVTGGLRYTIIKEPAGGRRDARGGADRSLRVPTGR